MRRNSICGTEKKMRYIVLLLWRRKKRRCLDWQSRDLSSPMAFSVYKKRSCPGQRHSQRDSLSSAHSMYLFISNGEASVWVVAVAFSTFSTLCRVVVSIRQQVDCRIRWGGCDWAQLVPDSLHNSPVTVDFHRHVSRRLLTSPHLWTPRALGEGLAAVKVCPCSSHVQTLQQR